MTRLRPGDRRCHARDGDRGRPCPVVQVKTDESDGYEAVNSRSSRSPSGSGTSRGSATSARPGGACHLVEFRGVPTAWSRRHDHRRGVPAGRPGQSSGVSIGKGFAGTISGTASAAARRPTVRTTSARPGRSSASATLPRLRACGWPAGWAQAGHAGRPDRSRSRSRTLPAPRQGCGSGAKNAIVEVGGGRALMATPKAPVPPGREEGA